ncbi:hypothetical protein D1007_57437 [Hordeum vulgare]|nr:hypothetical protein D1007_57437 [Hordeum vulgare]
MPGLNKLVVDICELKLDPKVVAVLDTDVILITGLPDIAFSEWVIRNTEQILGKVVVVDELSLRKEEEEVLVNTKCLDSDKACATVHVFFNDLGYKLPRDDRYNGAHDDRDGEWDEHYGYGRHNRSNDEEDFSDHS